MESDGGARIFSEKLGISKGYRQVLEPSFPTRDVTIKRGVNAKELYELISEVGRGKFGTVYKCREKATGVNLAAKFVPMPKREDRRNVEREVEIMNSLQHHLIIQLYAAYEYQKMMCVVLELIEGGELFDRVIDDDFVLTEKACTVFMRQVCEAMQFIHRNNILHLDMKPENILCLTKEGNRIKIIDFGLARKYDPDKKLQILFGTPEFVAPEVVNFDTISYGTDMWSVGVICYVLLSGLSPFMGETDIETMANVTVAKYDFDDEAFNNVSPEALDFISKLLVKDCSSRMTATECLEHKWLQRKLRPPIAPKPVAVPPPKYITTPPSPPQDSEAMELETTKDNLKTFIERWEEHPNSPYVFDTGTNLIAPLRDAKQDSLASSRVCTPSPCESICSLPETLNDFDALVTEVTENRNHQEKENNSGSPLDRNFKDYLQSFDRRNSDTNYILGKRPAGERINLADEIRKLSDHLLMLAEINTKLGKNSENVTKEHTSLSRSISEPGVKSTTTSTKVIKDKSDKISPKTKPETIIKKSDSQFMASSKIEYTKSTAVIKDTNENKTKKETNISISKSSTNVSALTMRLQSLEGSPKLVNGIPEEKPRKLLNGFKQMPTVQEGTRSDASFGVPWPVTNRRTKFKINQMSRDVPIGSPDSHRTFNLEQAANTTKDCLLHLLEKYNDTKLRHGSGQRHQSISVDCSMSDNLEYKSMSSINAFFQRHSTSGNTIKQLRAQLESKCKQ